MSFLANAEGWHGKALSAGAGRRRRSTSSAANGTSRSPRPSPSRSSRPSTGAAADEAPPVYDGPIATRKAFGDALAWLAGRRTGPRRARRRGRATPPTPTTFQEVAPERFFEVYIAEQTMVGAQIGMQALGKVAFSATFGAFFTRATDFVRMGAIGRADLRLCGSHAGVSIGEDGPSQMALEDLATMRALHGSTVLYPADGNATVKLVDGHVRPAGHLVHPDHARGDVLALRRRTRSSRSAAARRWHRRRTIASRWSAPASRSTSAWARRRRSPPKGSRRG